MSSMGQLTLYLNSRKNRISILPSDGVEKILGDKNLKNTWQKDFGEKKNAL